MSLGTTNRKAFNPLRWLNVLGFVLVAVALLMFILLPIYWMLKSSFQSNIAIRAVPTYLVS